MEDPCAPHAAGAPCPSTPAALTPGLQTAAVPALGLSPSPAIVPDSSRTTRAVPTPTAAEAPLKKRSSRSKRRDQEERDITPAPDADKQECLPSTDPSAPSMHVRGNMHRPVPADATINLTDGDEPTPARVLHGPTAGSRTYHPSSSSRPPAAAAGQAELQPRFEAELPPYPMVAATTAGGILEKSTKIFVDFPPPPPRPAPTQATPAQGPHHVLQNGKGHLTVDGHNTAPTGAQHGGGMQATRTLHGGTTTTSATTNATTGTTAAAAAAPAAKAAPAAAGTRTTTQPSTHPSLPPKDTDRPSPALLQRLGAPQVSATDMVLTITFPPNATGRLNVLHRPARMSISNTEPMYNAMYLLGTSLAIPAPRLPVALSTFTTVEELLTHLHTVLSSQGKANPPLQHYIDGITQALEAEDYNEADDHGLTPLGEALYTVPAALSGLPCHNEYTHYLNPSSGVMAHPLLPHSSGAGSSRQHVVRLGLNSPLVSLALRHHLHRYMALFRPNTSQALPTKGHMDSSPSWEAAFYKKTISTTAIRSEVSLKPFYPRYMVTELHGFRRGPDPPPPGTPSAPRAEGVTFDSLDEVSGNQTAFFAHLSHVVPHCYHEQRVSWGPSGTGTITFVHELQHRTELFALNGSTAPAAGVHRPLRLKASQFQAPIAQCCSYCGKTGHKATLCPSISGNTTGPSSDIMDTDDNGGPPTQHHRGVPCRHCYSPLHQGGCQEEAHPEQRTCRICSANGHTSFGCPQYGRRRVPLTIPATTRPPNPRPSQIVAQQRQLPWSQVISSPPGGFHTTPRRPAAPNATSLAHFPPPAAHLLGSSRRSPPLLSYTLDRIPCPIEPHVLHTLGAALLPPPALSLGPVL